MFNLFIDDSFISVLTLRATWIHSYTRMASEKSCMTFSNTSKTLLQKSQKAASTFPQLSRLTHKIYCFDEIAFYSYKQGKR